MKNAKDDNLVVMPGRVVDDLVGRVARALEGIERPVDLFSKNPGVAVPAERLEKKVDREAVKPASGEGGIVSLDVQSISFSPFQTREESENETLLGLSQSIKSKGMLQPIIVRRLSGEKGEHASYELVAGERRLRAAVRAGLSEVPALVRELSDRESLELSVVENAQRENLGPIEEARAFKKLADEFNLSQTEISRLIGKNRVSISNALRLLELPQEVIELLNSGELSAGHGRALLMAEDADTILRLARRAVKQGLSVRKLEALASAAADGEAEAEELSEEQLEVLKSLERQKQKVQKLLDLERVELKVNAEGQRRLSLVFDTEASWRRFLSKIRD